MAGIALMTRAEVQGYKSVGKCAVDFPMLSFLVGRNGAGKSNFLDALRFLSDAMNTNLDAAFQGHGSAGSVLALRHEKIMFDLTFTDPIMSDVRYVLELGVEERSNYFVKSESVIFEGTRNDLRLVGEGEEPLA